MKEQFVSKQSRVRINLGSKTKTAGTPTSRVRINLRVVP